MKSTIIKSRIAVIGAGIAGLSCATALQNAGLNVIVFEKSRGPSGRMSTRLGNGWQCDHGAQYFTAQHPDFCSEVTRWKNAGVAGLWTPKLVVIDDGVISDAVVLSERFVGIPGMNAPGHFLAKSLTLKTDTTIQKLQHQSDGWHMFSAEHGWLDGHYDAVILALPAPQARNLLNDLCHDLAELASSAFMRGCWSLMVRFTHPIGLPFDAAFVNHGPLGWIALDSSKPERGGTETWLLHANVEWSENHIEDDAEDVASSLLQELKKLGAPEPEGMIAHRWRFADSATALKNEFAWKPGVGLGMCGDWLHDGRVEGAWLSGRKLAKQVLKSMNTKS
jgi:renalase